MKSMLKYESFIFYIIFSVKIDIEGNQKKIKLKNQYNLI